jgi:protein-tyrosine phosphatase
MIKVLFVCMGNICRSPTAEGIFSHLIHKENLSHVITVDSAGTHAYHVGNPPDHRAQITAQKRDIDLSKQSARRVRASDFKEFDYILAMDEDNLLDLQEICPAEYLHKVQLFLEYAPNLNLKEVPDPYYGGPSGFDRVLDMVEIASEGLLGTLRERHSL